jgi:hypothetical protein
MLTVSSAKPQPLALRLRIPAWAAGSTVKINGKPLGATAEPASYLTIHRTWKTGDRVELGLPMRLSVEAMPDDAATQAFLYGPLVLAGDLGNEGLSEDRIVGVSGPAVNRPRPTPQPSPAAPATIGAQISLTAQIDMSGDVVQVPQRPSTPAFEIPTFQAAAGDPALWIKPGEKPLTFHTTGQKKDVTLAPLHSLFDTRYSVYWKVT